MQIELIEVSQESWLIKKTTISLYFEKNRLAEVVLFYCSFGIVFFAFRKHLEKKNRLNKIKTKTGVIKNKLFHLALKSIKQIITK